MSQQENKMIGIYKIENKQNHRVYIGQSKDILKRWNRHKRELILHKHINSMLQRASDKYGLDVFSFEILEQCEESDLNEKEKKWLDFYGGLESDKTYNLKDAGDYQKLSKESIKKVSDGNKGKKRTPEQRKRYSECRKEIIFTEEWCDNISKSKKGNQYTKGYKKIEKDGKTKTVKPSELESYLEQGWKPSHKMFSSNYERVVWNKGTKGICKANSGTFKKGNKLSKATKEKMRIARQNTIWVNNGIINKRIHQNELEQYTKDGYQRGRIKK